MTQPTGIENYGSTCYLNALLQALSSLNNFETFLQENENISSIFGNFKNIVSVCNSDERSFDLSVHQIIESIFCKIPSFGGYSRSSSMSDNKNSTFFTKFKNFFKNNFNEDDSNNQQDPDELLLLLLNLLQDENSRLKKLRSDQIRKTLEILCESSKPENALIQKFNFPFQYLLGSSIFCKYCNKSAKNSFKVEQQYILRVEMPKTSMLNMNFSGQTSLPGLYNSLDEKCNPENLHYAKCEKCHQTKHPITGQPILCKIECLTRIPKIAIIHINRITLDIHGNATKNNSFLSFPRILNLASFQNLPPSSEFVDKLDFELSAVIVHVGNTPNFGHYVTFRKFNNSWFLVSDKNVRQVSEAEVFGCEAYMLFYERYNN